MCIDYTDLNKHCSKDPFPLPRCSRKISTSRQAHSKLNEASLKHVPDPKRASQFPETDKGIKIVMELAGWYQTVPYLRLESQLT
jgi:hypothetical protein